MGILQPPKLYLDTNHLIEIGKQRRGGSVRPGAENSYQFIDQCLQSGLIGLIFNPAAPLEWVDGNATRESAVEIAAVVDSALLQYEVEKDSFVFLWEIQAELRRLAPNIQLPEFEVLLLRSIGGAATRPLAVLKNQVPGFFDEGELFHDGELPSEIPFATAAEHVEGAFKLKNERPHVYNERVAGHKAAFQQDVETFGGRSTQKITDSDVIGWMKRFVRIDRVIHNCAPDVDVDELLEQIDVTRCPAVDLFLRAHEHRVRAGNAPRDNDADDWMFVPVVPYATVVLTERNLSHFIGQASPAWAAKVTHDPNRAAELLREWVEPNHL